MEDRSIQKLEGLYIRLAVKIVLGLALFIGLIWGGHRAVVRLKQDRLLKQAHASFAKHDDRWAVIAAQRVFELDPKNAEACRILADVLERQGAPAAVEWRQQVLKLQPGSLDDILALARTALRIGQIEMAEHALEKVAPQDAKLASVHELKGEVALAQNNAATAQAEFAEALRIDPQNKRNQMNLAVAQLQSTSSEERNAASETVQKFLDDAELQKPAARALRDYGLRERDPRIALANAERLAKFPNAEFQDRLAYLHMLRQLNHPDYAVQLLDVQEEAATDPAKTYALLMWLSSTQQDVLALDWAKRLPPATLIKWPVAGAMAECYAAAKDWADLEEACRTADWGEMEYLRHAALARAFREQGKTVEAEREWNAAYKAVGSDGNKISTLQKTVARWGWKNESLELLWQLSKDPAQQIGALNALYEYYGSEGDTANLYRVSTRLTELQPDDPRMMNNVAQLALLLGVDKTRAGRLAQKVHEQEPANAAYASTFAFSLYTQGQVAEALNVFRNVDGAELRNPSIAAYYGIVLVAAGEKDKAREYLQLARTATLLPEEKELVARATAAAG